MSRPLLTKREEFQLAMPHTHRHFHHHQHQQQPSQFIHTHIACSPPGSKPQPPSSSLSSSLSSKSSTLPRKKSLQVHWHPSVNQRQAAKRNRQIVSLLGILLVFSSLTLILYHLAGCDLGAGDCQKTRALPRHRTTRLATSATAHGSDRGATTGAPVKNKVKHSPWSFLYGGPPSVSWVKEKSLEQALVGEKDKNKDRIFEPILDTNKPNDDNNDEGDKEDEFVEAEEELVEEEYKTTGDGDDDNEVIGFATPQEALGDIWSEGSNILTEEEYLELEEDYEVDIKGNGQLPQSIRSRLDPGTRYMTYLPFSGLTHQFFGMLRAIMIAKSLDRTLILPPITGWNHDHAGLNQPWSAYFDLTTFSYLTGVKVVELQDVREQDRITGGGNSGGSLEETLNCHVTFGMGSLRPLDITAKEFLKQWRFDLVTTEVLEMEATELGELVQALKGAEHEQMLCLTNGYKVEVPTKKEWDLYGQFMHFTVDVERFFSEAMQKLSRATHSSGTAIPTRERTTLHLMDDTTETALLNDFSTRLHDSYEPTKDKNNNQHQKHQPNISTPPHHPYISIHVRRGDYVQYCQTHFQDNLEHCLPTTQELASALHDLHVADPYLRGLPVYVSTNEDRSEELSEFKSLGWHVLDHTALGSVTELGVFGAAMMDQVMMAQAEVLIGVRTSAFLRLAAYRQEDWYAREVAFV